MKFSTLLFFLAFFTLLASAQQRPHYSQYVQNMSVLNPAVTGMYSGININGGIRSQWQGVESAPKTSYLTVSMPISFGGDMATYRASDLGVTQPATRDDKYDYQSSINHHALGLVFINDATGPLNRVTANLTYAYHLSISDIVNLSAGLGMGVNRVGLDVEKLKFEEEGDPVVANSNEINKYTPDLNFGLYLYRPNFYVGAVMQQILSNKLAFNGALNSGKEVPHYFITGGYQFFVGDDFSFTPSVMVKYVNPLPKSFDLNLKVAFRNNIWLGGSYRKKDAIAGMFGFNVSKIVSIGYAYDYTTSQIKTISSGSHEIALGIKL